MPAATQKRSPKGRTRSRARGSRRRGKGGTTLIRGGFVITMDDQDRVGRWDVRLEDGRVAAIGAKLTARNVDTMVDAKGMVVLPGLVQGHVHLGHSLFRGQAGGLDALSSFRSRLLPLEGGLTAEDVRAAVDLGLLELALSGVTTVMDGGLVQHTDVLFERAAKSGLRYVGGKMIMDYGQGYPAALREDTESALAESVRLCEAWHGHDNDRLRYAFSPRSLLSSTDDAFQQCVTQARQRGALLFAHAAESAEEVGLIRERTGHGVVEHLRDLEFVGPDVLLAHAIWISPGERRVLQDTATGVVHCPGANLRLGSGVARVRELLDDGVPVILGAASAASNDRLDVFAEMRLSALLHNARGGPDTISAATALSMATRDGARVLGWKDAGSIAVGQRADLIALDVGGAHWCPWPDDLISRLVFSARPSDVHTVIVDGRVVVADGRVVGVNARQIIGAANRAAERVAQRVS